ncbi:MAG: hypothetical protein IKG46_06530 [Solobacterium sp.]|nr:hypothetical protein [Solobacterium sp.]
MYTLKLGSCSITLSFLYPKTHLLFDDLNQTDTIVFPDIYLDPDYLLRNRWLVDGEVPEETLEFHCLMLACGNYILQYDHALFHGACFLWKDKAWIFTAPSGTGKTTQLRNWIRMWRKEIKILNGDKPVIECRKDGSVIASSSPWKGKENIGKPGLSAPLGGIILLSQGKTNKISRMTAQDSVMPLITEFVAMPETDEQLIHQGNILNKMLDVTPVWKLVNTGDKESAILTKKILEEYLENVS